MSNGIMATLAAWVNTIKGQVDTLHDTRLTSARAGYLDLLNTNLDGKISEIGGGGVAQVKLTSGSGNWTFPADLVGDFVYVTLVGGGGGGGLDNLTGDGGGGGGGAEVVYRSSVFIDSTNQSSIAYSVGSGGAGTTTAGQVGGNGGSTTFGSLTAEGGTGGQANLGYGGSGGGATGGVSPDTYDHDGVDGGWETLLHNISKIGGGSGGAGANNDSSGKSGGDSLLGSGGVFFSDAGGGGASWGRGGRFNDYTPAKGGGGAGSYTTSVASQDGGDGFIIIEYQVG